MPKRRTKHQGWTKTRTRMFQNLRLPTFHAPAQDAPPGVLVSPLYRESFTASDVDKIAAAEAKRAKRCARRLLKGF